MGDTNHTIDVVAQQTGFGDRNRMRRAFLRALAYRRRRSGTNRAEDGWRAGDDAISRLSNRDLRQSRATVARRKLMSRRICIVGAFGG
jgi:hypothetical protein